MVLAMHLRRLVRWIGCWNLLGLCDSSWDAFCDGLEGGIYDGFVR